MPDVEILDPDDPKVRELIEASDRFYLELYPSESNHLESIDELKQPNVVFLGCRRGAELAACGAAKMMTDDGGYAEVKRLFVGVSYRGQGLSLLIMQHLEAEIRRRKMPVCRLETGVKQPQAIELYRKLGYLKRGPFGAYQPDPLSVFMEKELVECESA